MEVHLFYTAPDVTIKEVKSAGILCDSNNQVRNRTNYDTIDDNPFA